MDDLDETNKPIELFRPVGQSELDLIEASEWTAFPPRLDWQPIFYPVLNLEYARRIARDWNAQDPASGYAGYVTRFHVQRRFLARYTVQKVGGEFHLEYWIPADDLAEFNRNLVGAIEVIESYARA